MCDELILSMADSTDFGELSNDADLKNRLQEFDDNFKEVEKILKAFCDVDMYDDLSPQDKVRYELFQAFAINSLYWSYLRVKGVDPNQHDIRSELNRVKDFMVKSKKIYEKQTLMPRIDQEAAKRFIRSGLWAPNQSTSGSQHSGEVNTASRKRKRDSDEDGENDS